MTHPFEQPVGRYMSADLAVGELDSPVAELARLMHAWNVSAVPIVDPAGALAGVVSRSDLIRLGLVQGGRRWTSPAAPLPPRRAREVMTRDPWTVGPAARIRDAARAMHDRQIHRVFVCEGQRVVGVLSTRDVAAAVRDARVATPLSEVMTTLVLSIDVRAPIGAAIEKLDQVRVSGLIVTEDDLPIGMFTQLDALCARDLPRSTPVEAVYDAAVICLPVETKLHRAAAHAAQLDCRRVVACRSREMCGVVGGLDFARVASGAPH